MQTETMSQRKVESIYRYEDEKGNLLFEVMRYEPKGFSQRRPGGKDGYIYNMQGVRRVLYKLPELIATPLDEPVYIVEGEKDVDRLMSLNLAATTNPGGAGKWLPEFNEYFRGRLVAIIADNDEPGRRHVQKVAESLCGIAASVKVIELPGLPAKGDVSDWLDSGHKFGELSILVDDTPEFVKEEPWTKKAEIISFDKIEPLDIDWLWHNRIPRGMLTLLVGDPGVGKSFLTLYMSAKVSTGGQWPDSASSPQADTGTVIILSCEDSPEHVICPRLIALKADLSKIKTIQCVRHKDEKGNEFTEQFNIMTDLYELQHALDENPDTKLVIIDPMSAYFGCLDTHKDSNVRSVIAPLVEIARRYNIALVGVMHLNKGNSSKAIYRTMGSLAFPASARTVWLVSHSQDGPKNPRRLLLPAKHNILKDPTTLAFEIKDGLVVFEDEPVAITADEILAPRSNIEAPERDRAVEWLKQLLAGGISMSSNEIMKLAEEEGFKKDTLAKARKELCVKCYPDFDEDGNKLWFWKLPRQEGEQPKLFNLKEAQARAQESLRRMSQRMNLR
jgi:putative DNA primase/helicase